MPSFVRRGAIAAASLVLGLAAYPAAASPVFVLTDVGGVGAGTNALAGFQQAAKNWTATFGNNVTVRLQVGFQSLGKGILGSTTSSEATASYTTVRSALVSHAVSKLDQIAVANLQPGNSLQFIANKDDPVTGIDARTRVLDNNNTVNNRYLSVTTANLKALGILGDDPTKFDAKIVFNSDLPFDFNPTDGITPGTFDFVGVAMHEIGHALGFVSGVDVVDYNALPNGPAAPASGLDDVALNSVLDLFRFNDGKLDWAVGGDPYFSVDGGKTALAPFESGEFNGSGRQASHWKDNLGIGIMDPTAARGERLKISELDREAFDAIGWNIPEPGSLAILAGGLAALVSVRRQRH